MKALEELPIDSNRQDVASDFLINKLVYVGSFGLGHRLSKLAAAHHLAAAGINVPVLEVQWNDCDTDMFAFLFGGTNILPIREPTWPADYQNKTILVRNDVSGYYAGQSYKNAEIPIDKNIETLWNDKLMADRVLFTDLFEKSFTGKDRVELFRKQHAWEDHFVIGLHLRAGNGEQDHFAQAARDIGQQTSVVETIRILIEEFYDNMKQQEENHLIKPPLVFVATDTPSWISSFRKAFSSFASVVTYPQPRVEQGQGVSYQQWKGGERCRNGWMAAAIDMALLSRSNVVVAATRSTFTQMAPASIVFGKQQSWSFCEMELNSKQSMSCFRDQSAWLFRRPVTSIRSFGPNNASSSVFHKVMVHLPDVTPDPALPGVQHFITTPVLPNETLYYYGRKYNPNYRKKREFREEWTRKKRNT